MGWELIRPLVEPAFRSPELCLAERGMWMQPYKCADAEDWRRKAGPVMEDSAG